jgi:hypothetical protein
MKKFALITICSLFLASASYAQDQPFRIGIKLGYPNFAGLNLEYVTPLLGGRIGPSVDFSYLPETELGDVTASFTYFEIGANVYPIRAGKGLYLNVGYGQLAFNGEVTDEVDFGGDVGTATGTASADIGLNRINFKLGTKLGGRVYFRTEFGWALGIGDSTADLTFSESVTGTTVNESYEIPSIIAGGPLANIGIGIGF